MKQFVFLFLIFMIQKGFSQNELRFYGGPIDYPGISYEHRSEKNLAFEFGASFRSFQNGKFYSLDVRENNFVVNGMIKKYRTNKKGKTNFFYGGYSRYWLNSNFVVNATKQPYSTSLQVLLDSNETVTYARRTNKISIGFLTGFTFELDKRFSFGINTGIGISIPRTYWVKTFFYNQPVLVKQYGENEWIGYFNHLSLMANVSFGYRFGKNCKKIN